MTARSFDNLVVGFRDASISIDLERVFMPLHRGMTDDRASPRC